MNNSVLLSVKEASEVFGIGQKRLRDIAATDYDFRYHLMLGRTIKIKRKPFEDYLYSIEEI